MVSLTACATTAGIHQPSPTATNWRTLTLPELAGLPTTRAVPLSARPGTSPESTFVVQLLGKAYIAHVPLQYERSCG